MTEDNLKLRWSKITAFCAYQERAPKEVAEKMAKLEVPMEKRQEWMSRLKSEKYVDEARFAEMYCRGKFSGRGWGKMKLRHGLMQKGIDPMVAEQQGYFLDDEEYLERAKLIAGKKWGELKGDKHRKLASLQRFLLQKGYEWEVIRKVSKP